MDRTWSTSNSFPNILPSSKSRTSRENYLPLTNHTRIPSPTPALPINSLHSGQQWTFSFICSFKNSTHNYPFIFFSYSKRRILAFLSEWLFVLLVNHRSQLRLSSWTLIFSQMETHPNFFYLSACQECNWFHSSLNSWTTFLVWHMGFVSCSHLFGILGRIMTFSSSCIALFEFFVLYCDMYHLSPKTQRL